MKKDNKEEITISAALQMTESALLEAGTAEAAVEAQWILVEVLGVKRFELFLKAEKTIKDDELKRLREIIERRRRREPLAYIIGHTDFRGHIIKLSRDTLIPRPETELLVDEALAVLQGSGAGLKKVLDVCTGSGCISLALAAEFEKISITSTDISFEALTIASENASCNKVTDKIKFIRADLLTAINKDAAFDLIISNPPYIRESDISGLAPEVRTFEPALALDGGPSGMSYIKKLIKNSEKFLRPGALILLEIGLGQGNEARAFADSTGFYEEIKTIKDLSGIERIFSARKKTF